MHYENHSFDRWRTYRRDDGDSVEERPGERPLERGRICRILSIPSFRLHRVRHHLLEFDEHLPQIAVEVRQIRGPIELNCLESSWIEWNRDIRPEVIIFDPRPLDLLLGPSSISRQWCHPPLFLFPLYSLFHSEIRSPSNKQRYAGYVYFICIRFAVGMQHSRPCMGLEQFSCLKTLTTRSLTLAL